MSSVWITPSLPGPRKTRLQPACARKWEERWPARVSCEVGTRETAWSFIIYVDHVNVLLTVDQVPAILEEWWFYGYWKPMFLICNFQGPECCRLSSFKCILLARSMPLSLVQHIQLAFIKSHSYLRPCWGTWLTLLPLLVEISNKRAVAKQNGLLGKQIWSMGSIKKKTTAQNSVLIVWTKWGEHLVLL